MKPSRLFLPVLLLIATAGLAQSSRPTTGKSGVKSTVTVKKTAEKPDPTRAVAEKLFKSAVENQVGQLARGSVRSFEGRFRFLANTPKTDNKPNPPIEGIYLQKWAFRTTKGKEQFAYRRTVDADLSDWQSTLVSDFEGFIFGLDKGRPLRLNDKRYDKDKERIREEKRAARRLFRLLFLNEMEPQSATFKIEAKNIPCPINIAGTPASIRLGSKKATVISFVTANNQKMKLWIDTADKATPEVMRAEVVDPDVKLYETAANGEQKRALEVFELGYYVPVSLPSGEKVLFPARVRYSVGSREAMLISVEKLADIRINAIKNLRKTFEAE